MSHPVPAFQLVRATALLLATLMVAPTLASAAATTVREPAFSFPHFYGDTDVEMARENGREIAKDRLVQMILLARVGRGTLHQALGILDPGLLNQDINTRRSLYTSSELNGMYDKLPADLRAGVLAYCEGVNDTIEGIYAGSLPEPLEVTILRTLGLSADLFGNATDISDGLDPTYRAPFAVDPNNADPNRPLAGFQFTPEILAAVAVLEVRNFGLEGFNENSRLNELQAMIDKHGETTGEEIWLDLNFLNDPLAPVSVPDATTPGFGGPLAAAPGTSTRELASARPELTPAPPEAGARPASARVVLAKRFPRYDYLGADASRREAAERRAETARRLGAWPSLGSYSWVIAGNRSATGNPWVGGFPQTGIQTPSIMHFAENRSGEGTQGIGMEFAGAGAIILIGQTDTVAWTSTTAQLRVVDTFLEEIVGEDTDTLRYNDQGAPAALSQRTEIFAGIGGTSRVFWRSHERGGNGGSRPILDFLGDQEGTASGGDPNALVDSGAGFGGDFVGGHVAIVDGTGAGQIREISAVPDGDTLEVGAAWTTPPDSTSVYVAAESGNDILGVASDSAAWLEETTTAIGFSLFQSALNVLDVRTAVRLIPSTHNFPSADNQAFNGIGTDGTGGNIGYYSSGFSRVRQGGEDKLLPLDGTEATNPLVVVSGTVTSADPNTLVSTGTFLGETLDAAALNFRYDNPTLQGSEFIVSITEGTGYKQTRRILSNDDNKLTLEFPWGVTPDPGDSFEVYEVVAMPEAINPSQGYFANWNNKAATADDGSGFGRNHRVAFITERLAADSSWDRDKQRQLNRDVAGLSGSGNVGRYLVPRLREAVDDDPNAVSAATVAALEALEVHQGSPDFGRGFNDAVNATTSAGEVSFLNSLINSLASDIYGDEFAGALGVPGGSRGLAMVLHAIDEEAADVPGSYSQEYAGDYFNGAGWQATLRNRLETNAAGGIPADSARGTSSYNHPLAGLFSELSFPTTPVGNRGTWEQIMEVGPVVIGEGIFPLGQSGHLEGNLAAVTFIDPHNTTLHPVWRNWKFVPLLHVSEDLAGGGDGDLDDDGVLDGFERWYFGDTSRDADDDGDADGATLLEEFLAGIDPTDSDTDMDGLSDGDELTAGANPLDRDSDADGLLDGDPNSDPDGDGTVNKDDNCVAANPGQHDSDGDGVGNICEAPQVQDKDEQKCIVEVNKNFAKVAKKQGKTICKCIKDGSKNKLLGTIEECIVADADGKVAKAQAKAVTKIGAKCTTLPDFGGADASTANSVAVAKELSLIHAIFGSDLDDVIVKLDKEADKLAEDDPNNPRNTKAEGKCQVQVAKLAKKCQDAKLKAFNSCKKNGLKGKLDPLKVPDPNAGRFDESADLEDCLGFDPKGKILKACVTKMDAKIVKKCTDVVLSVTFPPLDPNATLGDLADFVDARVECEVCLGVNAVDGTLIDCDLFDDGLANGSCPASP